jgi:hypothetical protein
MTGNSVAIREVAYRYMIKVSEKTIGEKKRKRETCENDEEGTDSKTQFTD